MTAFKTLVITDNIDGKNSIKVSLSSNIAETIENMDKLGGYRRYMTEPYCEGIDSENNLDDISKFLAKYAFPNLSADEVKEMILLENSNK